MIEKTVMRWEDIAWPSAPPNLGWKHWKCTKVRLLTREAADHLPAWNLEGKIGKKGRLGKSWKCLVHSPQAIWALSVVFKSYITHFRSFSNTMLTWAFSFQNDLNLHYLLLAILNYHYLPIAALKFWNYFSPDKALIKRRNSLWGFL